MKKLITLLAIAMPAVAQQSYSPYVDRNYPDTVYWAIPICTLTSPVIPILSARSSRRIRITDLPRVRLSVQPAETMSEYADPWIF